MNASEKAPRAGAVTLLTYNINDESLSDSALPGWTLSAQHAALKALILARSPDLLFLQECFGFRSALQGNYSLHGPVNSHRGECWIGLRQGGPFQAAGPAFAVGPSVLLPLLYLGRHRLHVASAHLQPFTEGARQRAAQIARIVAAVPAGEPLILAGDTNMREPETPVAAAQGLADAWVAAGGPPHARWTWDTRANRYYEGGRAYTARYDRVLYRGVSLVPGSLAVAANEPHAGVAGWYLSDHFALAASLQVGAAGAAAAVAAATEAAAAAVQSVAAVAD